jgi:predicted ATPase
MEGKRLLRSLSLRNILSYGSLGEEITLEPLNVLIGRNASGKSNLIEAIGLLRSTPKDLTVPIREGGGIGEWLWKGIDFAPEAALEAVVDYPQGIDPLQYKLGLTMVGQRMSVTMEAVGGRPYRSPERIARADVETDLFYGYQDGTAVLRSRKQRLQMGRDLFNAEQSILSQIKDPNQYPELTYLGNAFGEMRLFRELSLGRNTLLRMPQKTDLPEDFLLEDASNLALVLNDLQNRLVVRQQIIERLREFYSDVVDITTKIQGGTVQIFVHEKRLAQPVSAARLSDGTLRYLCLLTILCHPTPPPLVCIEEPELGLHPDILPTVAELLIEASPRTQLIVTTHSDVLVSALSDTPEAILVCERGNEGTHVRRLEREPLKEWLEKYSLGELWRMGEIGGS